MRRQDDSDWELIVSDNCSGEEIGGYIQSLRDPRIAYYRTDSFVSVTENWNNALERSSGDYVIMLGDDDGLLPGYFSTMRRLIDLHDRPDAIYTGAVLYAYPGAMPGYPDGYLRPYSYAAFFRDAERRGEARWLDSAEAWRLVRASCGFRAEFGFNMQFVLVSRAFIQSVQAKGPFFQSPFPDYFAMHALFLTAPRILTYARAMVTIGVTPRSYGAFHFGRRDAKGDELLNTRLEPEIARRLEGVLLPGNSLNDGWLFAMETLRERYGPKFPFRIDYRRYRLLQALSMAERRVIEGHSMTQESGKVSFRLGARERALLAALAPLRVAPRVFHRKVFGALRRVLRQTPRWRGETIPGSFASVLDVFDRFDATASESQRLL